MWVVVCASVQTRYSQELKDEDGAVVLSPGYTLESHGLDTTPVMMGVGGRWAWLRGFPYFLQFKSEFGNKEFMV